MSGSPVFPGQTLARDSAKCDSHLPVDTKNIRIYLQSAVERAHQVSRGGLAGPGASTAAVSVHGAAGILCSHETETIRTYQKELLRTLAWARADQTSRSPLRMASADALAGATTAHLPSSAHLHGATQGARLSVVGSRLSRSHALKVAGTDAE